MNEVEKECEICGKFFRTNNPIRKYCDDCTNHSSDKKKQYASALQKSRRRMYGPEVFEITCAECGRKVKTIASYVIAARDANNERHVFCCERCKNKWKEEHAACAFCGKPMLGTGRYNPRNNREQYCSDDCQEMARWDIARKEGYVHKCVRCGKEYIRKSGGLFCSNECYRAALNDGWRPKKPTKKETLITRNEVCTCCKKRYKRTHKGELPLQTYTFCSDDCLRKFRKEAVERAMG